MNEVKWDYSSEALQSFKKYPEYWKNNRDFKIIQVGMDIIDNELRIFISPNHLPSETEINANKNCKTCGGTGSVRYFFYQDESRQSVCPTCYPNDNRAKELQKEWREFNR